MLDIVEVLKDGGLLSKVIPNYKQRDQQIKYALAVEAAIENGKTLLAEAPTGTGKSVGYLVPAILSGKKTLVATATKTLQDQLIKKDIPLLKEAGLQFKAALVKGRGNYISLRRFKEYKKETKKFEHLLLHEKIEEWLQKTETGDLEELPFKLDPEYEANIRSDSDDCEGKSCPYYRECFFYKARKEAQKADILIANQDLLAIDLVVRNTSPVTILPDYEVLVIDEAHQFEEIIAKYLGFKLSKKTFQSFSGIVYRVTRTEKEFFNQNLQVKDDLAIRLHSLTRKAEAFFGLLAPVSKNDPMRIHSYHITDEVESLAQELIKQMYDVIEFLEIVPITDPKTDKTIELAKQRADNIKTRIEALLNLERYYDTMVFWSEISQKSGNVSVHCRPIDVSPYLSQWLFSRKPIEEIEKMEEDMETVMLKSVILTSATMTVNKSFEFLKNSLGIKDNPYELIGDHVFDYGRQAVLYIPPSDVPEPSVNSDDFTNAVAEYVIDLLKISEGRAFVLFTSYKEMDRVYEKVKGKVPYKLLKQGDKPKAALIEEFKKDIHSVLFGTSSFWEGVDVQGEALSLVIIDKIPFPVPTDPIVEAKVDYIKRRGGNWFLDYYVPVAGIALTQGFGRLIRTIHDRGVVAIMDRRILTKNYGARLLNSLPRCYRTSRIEEVEKFFQLLKTNVI